MTSSSVLQQ